MTAGAPIPAVFDVDRTLIEGMSGRYLVEFLWHHRVYSIFARYRILLGLWRYHKKQLGEDEVVRLGATTYRGLSVAKLRYWGERCFDEVVRDKIFPDARAAVKDHMARGHHVILASGSSNFIVEPLGRHFGVHAAIGTTAAVRFGKSTADIETPLCYGEGKRQLVESYLTARGMSLDHAFVYSDSSSDLPLMNRAKHPIAVNPAGPLEAVAQARGWPVFRWTLDAQGTK